LAKEITKQIKALPPVQMDDAISRRAAIDATTETVFVEYEENADKEESIIRQTKAAIRDRIKALPPVQTEIIHCKDCAFYEKEIGGNDGFALGMCRFIEQHYVTNEGFCFWAKKKGE